MGNDIIDILMITYNRPKYTKLALSTLLSTCNEKMRVWVWHNGGHAPTIEIVNSFASHSRLHKIHFSNTNMKLREPTNWFWKVANGEYLSKVDDDGILPNDWAKTLKLALEDEPRFGVLGCWRFQEEDFYPELAQKKLKTFRNGHKILQNCWVEGSGYLMRRNTVEKFGLLKKKQSFTSYCISIARKGYVNGWYYPFIRQEHMDDPRSPNTELRTEDDFIKNPPLTALNNNISSRDEWIDWIKRDALRQQTNSIDPRYYSALRRRLRKICPF